MAVSLTADNQFFTASITSTAYTAYTLACWGRLDVDRNDYSTFLCLDDNSGAAFGTIQCTADGTTVMFSDPGIESSGVALTVGTWYFMAVAKSGTTGTLYVRAADATSFTTVALSGLVSSSTVNTIRIGETTAGTDWLNGSVCAVKYWLGAQLSQADLENEYGQFLPRRTLNLSAFFSLLDVADLADLSGNGLTLSGGSGTATTDSPPIPWRGPTRPQPITDSAAVVNGTATVTGTGSVTAVATQAAGASATGTGSVTAAAVQAAGTSVTGAGSVTALATQRGGATVAGAGSVTALATQRAVASVAGAGSVSAVGLGAGLSTLADDFDDNSIDTTKWPGNYGTVAESGGRARLTCDTSFNAYVSASIYAFDSFYLRAFPPPAAGAATTAYLSIFVTSPSQAAGTDVGFSIDAVTGNIQLINWTGFSDAGLVTLTYDSTNHAWLRLAVSAGNLLWQTSPDGFTWATRRTTTTPSWLASSKDCKIFFESHRDSGTNNVAEIDNFNAPPPAGASVTGAGSVTAAAVQGAAGNPTGAGSVTAAATQAAGASATGAGSVTAAAVQRIQGTASVAGAGSATALAVQGSGASVTGAGSTIAAATQRAGASVTGAGSVTAPAVQIAGASVTGAGSVAAAPGGVTTGTASVAGVGSVTALAVQGSTSSAAGVGAATALATQRAGASVTGAGSVTAAAGGAANGTAAVTGAGAVTAAAAIVGAATVVGSGAATAVASIRVQGAASVAAVGSVTAAGGIVIYVTATVTGLGIVTAAAGSRITPRPNSGITVRPYTGITPWL